MNYKKIISIVIIIITLLSNITPLMAVTFEEGQTIKLQKDHDCISLLKIKGQDVLKGVTYVMYYNSETGEKQPAFCVEPEKQGIGTGAGDNYDVTLSMLEDESLWRILFKGYMGSNYSEWGLEIDDDLYYATKTAVHCLVQNIAPVNKYEVPNRVGWGEDISLEDVQRRGKKVLEVAQELYNYGINGSEKYMEAEVSVKENADMLKEIINGKNYLVQKYIVSGNREISSYTVSIQNFTSGTKIFNSKNEEVSNLNENSFKIAVPEEEIKSNINGKINITDIKIKSYPVFYAKAYDENIQDYITYASIYDEVNTNTTLSIDAYKSGLKIIKIDEETGKKLSGVVFNVKYTDTNENIGDFVTDEEGKIEINGLRQGNITVTEIKTKDQYILKTEPINVSLKYNEIKEITVENTTKRGNIKIIKVDDENNEIRIPNVEFTLYNSDKVEIGKYVTDKNGEIEIKNLKTGTYYIKETNKSEEYCPLEDEIKIEVKWNETAEKIIENEKKKGQIKVIKIDKDNNEIRLEGVKFEVIDSNQKVVETLVTDKNGEVNTSMLPIGKYTLREIETQENYILNEENITVEIKWNEETEQIITNKHKEGNIKIKKIDAENNETRIPGVEFTLYNSDKIEIGKYVTDENGEIEITKLKIDTYYIKETKENDKYCPLEDEIKIEVKWNETTEKIIENEKKKGQIKVLKIDEDYNQIKLEGVKFEVIDSNENVVETLVTDKNGEATTSMLPIGKYRLREIETQQDYILDEKNITLEVKWNEETEQIITNKHKMGNLKIYKLDADNNKIALGGVEFDLYSEEFGKVVGNYTTDSNGEIVIKNLRIGNYKLIEKKTNKWYDLGNDVEIKIEWDTTINWVIENELKKGSIKIIKVDSENNEIKLEGVVFEVLNEDGKVIETITTNKEGEAVTSRYSTRDYEYLIIKEVATNKNYVLNDEPIKIKLHAHQIQEITVENCQKKGKVKIIKVDSNNNEIGLSGVKFEIYNKNNNELIETLITDSNGEAISKELPCKYEYIIKEVETNENYILNDVPQTVILQQDEIKELLFKNEKIEIKVNVEKDGIIETEAGKNISYDFKNIQNNSNVSLDDFVWADILPTDAVRIDKLITGTWNEDLKYSVWYKTNKHEFKCIKEGLSTQENNEINFKELTLEEDEYITEYQLRFGKVKAGFMEVEAPKLYCDVLENLDNGYKFTNETKVSGSYKEEGTEDEDEWTTIVYNKEPEKEELPRTGC